MPLPVRPFRDADPIAVAFGAITVAGILLFLKPVAKEKHEQQTMFQAFLKVDWLGSGLYIVSSVCILLALQVDGPGTSPPFEVLMFFFIVGRN